MMPSKSKFINIDYNDLVLHPDIESVFGENPDSILEAFSRAIKEILQERFPKYAKKIEHEIRARIANYPVQRSLRQINAEVIGKITSVSRMVFMKLLKKIMKRGLLSMRKIVYIVKPVTLKILHKILIGSAQKVLVDQIILICNE